MALRVLIVSPWGERLGGAEEGLWQALRHCDRELLEPTVVFLGPGEFEREVAALGMATVVIPTGRLRQPVGTARTVATLSALLRDRRPDLILNWSAKAQIYGSPAALAAGMGDRVLWWQQMIPSGHWTDRFATIFPARAIGCWSDASRRAQVAMRPRRETFVVNPGIVVDEKPPSPRTDLRRKLGIPDGRLVVGIVGRLQPWKGQDRFLRALAELRRRGHDAHGLVVGGDAYDLAPEYAGELERLISSLQLAGAVTMTGQVPDSRPYFELMDVAVNASEEEPFGIVLIEAMAAGAPVVAVGRGGPLDIVDPGVTGLLTASGQPGPLADALDRLLADPDLRAAMSAAGRRRCRERFGAQAMTDRLTSNLIEIARG